MTKDVAPKSISIRPLSTRISLEDGDCSSTGEDTMKYQSSPDTEVLRQKEADEDRKAWLTDMQDAIAQDMREGLADAPTDEALIQGMNPEFAEIIRCAACVDRDDPVAMRAVLDDLQAVFDEAVELYAYEMAGRIPR